MVKTAPARQDQGNAATRAATTVHLHHPPAHVRGLHLRQIDVGSQRQLRKFVQIYGIQRRGSLGQAFLKTHMVKVTSDALVHAEALAL